MMKFLVLFNIILCCVATIAQSDSNESKSTDQKIGYEMHHPIAVKGIKSQQERDNHCQKYVSQHFLSYEITDTMLVIIGQDVVLEVSCRDKENDANLSLYFDISEYMNRLKRENKKANAKF